MADQRKRRREEEDYGAKRRYEPHGDGIGKVVAKHYNELEEKGVDKRSESKIIHMRNFNNWIKSSLINDVIGMYRERPRKSLAVLDLCCGKGGDIQKWIKSFAVRHVIFADIAQTSVEQCEERYKSAGRYQSRNMFSAEFIVADATKERLRTKYEEPGLPIDLVSIQFGFHYSFESLTQVETMLQNIAENLKFGGYLVGTIPNADRIVHKYREAGSKQFGNNVFNIRFEVEDPFPLFGAKYLFQLDEVVNCPEFLVHFPCFQELAAKYNLKLIFKHNFDEYFYLKHKEGEFLLNKMQALESFPRTDGSQISTDNDEFKHAIHFMKENPEFVSVGTLAKSEWEAISLYTLFCFQKVSPRQ